MSQFEVRRFANALSEEWQAKGHLEEEKMPLRWRVEVSAVRGELRRRGTQLHLFP